MKIHRFCLQNIDLNNLQENAEIEIKDKEIIHQIKDVFRFTAGNILNIFDGEDTEINVEIVEIHKNNLRFKILNMLSKENKIYQNRNITLAFAILKNDHTEIILEKCTELGVINFQPLITDRTIKTGLREDRLNKIIKEATEQSGFISLPTLSSQIKLTSFLQYKVKQNLKDNILILDMNGEHVDKYLNKLNKIGDIDKSLENSNEIILIIGPEGGWSDAERIFFQENNLQIFSLCLQTLRAETACITSVSKLT